MKWCLECHREPEKFLRPVELVTKLGWQPKQEADESADDAQLRVGLAIKQKEHVNPPDKNCFGCHR
jgi:hypothetical protein